MRLHMALAAAAALALGACASADGSTQPGQEGRDCFRSASANGFGIVDSNNVRVSISPNRNYILTSTSDANRLDWSRAIRINGPAYICVGRPAGTYLVGGEPEQAFIVTDVRRDPSDTAPSGS